MSEMKIYALQVGGGTLALCPMPGRYGPYSEDLDLIASWQPALVISLTTEVEMIEDGARHFGSDIQGRAARWAHLPVPDYGTPPREAEERWGAVSASARQALKGGGRVLIHCRGGCGRSGMAALRLMVECGEKPQEALARLRTVRPCAVENDAQRDWAFRGHVRAARP
ncbi:protein phosphatase [Cribrihabitans sp. XS_ASV171]